MDDRTRVEELLGRPPRGDFEVVVRDDRGDPVVLRNGPLLDDGTPMPTRYYLVGKVLVRDVSRLEAAGGVRDAERTIDADEIARVHERYAAERDALIPAGHAGPRPSGGVGGTRTGVKCLHAHVAHELAGGDDPVGRWALERLHGTGPPELDVVMSDRSLTFAMGDAGPHEIPVGPLQLLDDHLGDSDPPSAVALSNALGTVADHLDDVLIAAPEMRSPTTVRLSGVHVLSLARVECGGDELPTGYRISRVAADEVFRTLVAERPGERRHNPGLDPAHLSTIIPTCCVVLGVMRKLDLRDVRIGEADSGTGSG